MRSNLSLRILLAVSVLVAGLGFLSGTVHAEQGFVALPVIENDTVAPRVVYVENPRFPTVAEDEFVAVVRAAADLVQEHFGITVVIPREVTVRRIDDVFAGMLGREPPGFTDLIGDFRTGRVDWEVVREFLAKEIADQTDPLGRQIAFARPYLTRELERRDVESFSRAVVGTFEDRLSRWTVATLPDGKPVIGAAPYNEYGYWTLMAKRGIEAEIVLTNQLVASVEYMPVPVHTSIRGGITGGSTEYNPASKYGASVWVSLFPFLSDDPLVMEHRNGQTYTREEALTYAGAMLAHEMGHQLLQLGHPWGNEACVMRPAEGLDFAGWVEKFDAEKCPVGSSPAMTVGTVKAPVW